jgi:hypothetical protein
MLYFDKITHKVDLHKSNAITQLNTIKSLERLDFNFKNKQDFIDVNVSFTTFINTTLFCSSVSSLYNWIEWWMSTTFCLKSSYFNMRNEESFRQLIICNNSERTYGNRNGELNECINCNRNAFEGGISWRIIFCSVWEIEISSFKKSKACQTFQLFPIWMNF